jgi:predicted HicB family RNase H-like nuclease
MLGWGMKRIIDGVTYNTATAVKIARSRAADGHGSYVTMYQTRKGAFFFHIRASRREAGNLDSKYEDPRKFLESAEEVYLDPFSSPPAKAQGEAAIFVRAPDSLKRTVEQAAKKQGVSVNHLTVRCLENCLSKTKD